MTKTICLRRNNLTHYKISRLISNIISIYDISLKDFGDKLDPYKDLIFKSQYKVLFEYNGKQIIILYN